MPKRSLIDSVDGLIEALLRRTNAQGPVEPELAPLARIAAALRDLPRENFETRLKSDLERKAIMASPVETISALRQTATARLRVKNAAAAIDFYQKAFGARELMRFEGHGRIAHAEIAIGNSVIMLGEEAPEYGYPGPETLGGSPAGIHLYVDDADAVTAQAVAAGAKLVSPVSDQFYGDRSGNVADPFGYTWNIATHKEDLSVEEMQRRMADMERQQQAGRAAAHFIPEGFHTVTPYLRAQNVNVLIDFVKQTFGAEELRRSSSSRGIHTDIRVGDSILFMGGGAPELAVPVTDRPMAFHVYVKDTDATYDRALKAGAVSLGEPVDQPYGERGAGVKDSAGNYWYIATYGGENYIPEGMRSVTAYLHPRRADPLIQFLTKAFGAQELARYGSPDGVIQHASIRIGDSVLEMGEAHGPYQPMEAMLYLYIPDVDTMYHRAMVAGAISVSEPSDQPYGDRTATVKDAFGNQWVLATYLGRPNTPA